MGCDIHFFVERRAADGWEAVCGEGWFYSERNYYLFAHLADVRNIWEVRPIAEPRGLPEDASELVRDELADDRHSQSWYTLTELLDYDWPRDLAFFRDGTLHAIGRDITGTSPNDIRIVFAFDN